MVIFQIIIAILVFGILGLSITNFQKDNYPLGWFFMAIFIIATINLPNGGIVPY